MLFQIGCKCGLGGIWQFMYDTNKPAILEEDLVRLCVDGNWQILVRYYGGETVSIHSVKCITLSMLK